MQEKHFLDTSVARPMILGSTHYRSYFQNKFGNDSLYISRFVQMEFRRSFIKCLIDFYFVLKLPTIESMSDALALWSNRFKSSEQKTIIQFLSQVLQTRIALSNRSIPKAKALREIARLIHRVDVVFSGTFTDNGHCPASCSRAKVVFKFDLETVDQDFQKFLEDFSNVAHHRSNCQIDKFLLVIWKDQLEQYIQQVSKLPNNSQTHGFLKIAEVLQRCKETNGQACSCKVCEKIGDVVIAMDTPRDMCLEHTDNSFDYLCPPLKQPHFKHPSEVELHNAASRNL